MFSWCLKPLIWLGLEPPSIWVKLLFGHFSRRRIVLSTGRALFALPVQKLTGFSLPVDTKVLYRYKVKKNGFLFILIPWLSSWLVWFYTWYILIVHFINDRNTLPSLPSHDWSFSLIFWLTLNIFYKGKSCIDMLFDQNGLCGYFGHMRVKVKFFLKLVILY